MKKISNRSWNIGPFSLIASGAKQSIEKTRGRKNRHARSLSFAISLLAIGCAMILAPAPARARAGAEGDLDSGRSASPAPASAEAPPPKHYGPDKFIGPEPEPKPKPESLHGGVRLDGSASASSRSSNPPPDKPYSAGDGMRDFSQAREYYQTGANAAANAAGAAGSRLPVANNLSDAAHVLINTYNAAHTDGPAAGARTFVREGAQAAAENWAGGAAAAAAFPVGGPAGSVVAGFVGKWVAGRFVRAGFDLAESASNAISDGLIKDARARNDRMNAELEDRLPSHEALQETRRQVDLYHNRNRPDRVDFRPPTELMGPNRGQVGQIRPDPGSRPPSGGGGGSSGGGGCGPCR